MFYCRLELEHQAALCSSPWYSGDSMTAESAGTSAFVIINTVIALMLHLDGYPLNGKNPLSSF